MVKCLSLNQYFSVKMTYKNIHRVLCDGLNFTMNVFPRLDPLFLKNLVARIDTEFKFGLIFVDFLSGRLWLVDFLTGHLYNCSNVELVNG